MADPVTSFAVGTALGGAGLLLAFSGAVSGYNMLAEVFESDTGLHYTALQYNLELFKFQLWGERYQIEDETKCRLLNLPEETQVEIARVLAEISRKQEVAGESFLGKYRLHPEPTARPVDATSPFFSKESAWIREIKSQRLLKPANFWKRLRWTLSHKKDFEDLLGHLAKLNKDLWDLCTLTGLDADHIVNSLLAGLDSFWIRVRPKEVDEKQIAALVVNELGNFWRTPPPEWTREITTGIVAGVSEQFTANLDAEDKGLPSDLVKLLAQVQAVQNMNIADIARNAKFIDPSSPATSFEVGDRLASTGRHLGRYASSTDAPHSTVLVEWKSVATSAAAHREIVLRIQALAGLLCSTNAAAFSRLECLGLVDDAAFEEETRGAMRRFGIVYAMPKGQVRPPVSLLGLIKQAAISKTRPPLGQRFALAYKMASAVSLLHAAKWLHKSFTSENVVFNADGNISTPYIAGFQYSRPAGDQSLETAQAVDSELQVYYHPDVEEGWTKIKEIYSLGIVLLEIAYWRPLHEERYQSMKLVEISQAVRADLDGRQGDTLRSMVGSTYVDAVTTCLHGADSLGVVTGDSGWESKLLNDAFFEKVVAPLARCSA